MQQHGIGKISPIAVTGADRLGEPAQLAATARSPFDPLPVMPAERPAGERLVVFASAGRPGGAVDGDVQLVARRQPGSEMAGQQPRQAWRHGGPDDQRRAGLFGDRIEVEQRPHVVGVPAHRHHVRTAFEQVGGRTGVRAGAGEHDDVGDEVTRDELLAAGQIAAHTFTDDSAPDDGDAAHCWSRSIGCHPPCCGGVPPRPRTRKALAIAAARPRAASARRISFTSVEYGMPPCDAVGRDGAAAGAGRLADVELLGERLLGDLEVVEAHLLGIESGMELGEVGEHRRLIPWRICRLDLGRIAPFDLLGELGGGSFAAGLLTLLFLESRLAHCADSPSTAPDHMCRWPGSSTLPSVSPSVDARRRHRTPSFDTDHEVESKDAHAISLIVVDGRETAGARAT